MRHLNKIIASVFTIFFLVTSILMLVDAAQGLGELQANRSSYTVEAYAALNSIAVVELVFSIVCVISTIITFIICVAVEYDDYRIRWISATLFFGVLQKIIYTFQAIDFIKKFLYSNYQPDGIIITIIVFAFLALACLLVSYFASYAADYNKLYGGVISSSGLLILILYILSFSNTSSPSAVMIAYFIFMIFVSLSLLAYGLLVAFNPDSYRRFSQRKTYSGSSYSNSTYNSYNNQSQQTQNIQQPTPQPLNNEKKEAVEQLNSLKKLLDDGIITQEEYELKRKKYVDKL